MKKPELLLNLISIVVDLVMVLLSGVAAFYLRFELSELRPIIYELSLAAFLKILFLISPVIIFLLAASGLYNLKGPRRFSSELWKIFLAVSSGLLAAVILFFFNQAVFPSRLIILLTWALAIVLVSLGRIILRAVQINLHKRGIGLHRLVTVEKTSPTAIVSEIEKRPELGYKIIEKIRIDPQPGDLISKLEKIRAASGIDELLVADPKISAETNERLLS
ncbi:MAG: hypothetical protein HYV13_04395, partial [Candidatus Doudnabacteria bacterium]|nr:hypothetical protein [Candidatus Doudnabacteria bacterium]